MGMIHIVGIGMEGKGSLSMRALKLIENAGLLIGGRRHLASFPEFKRKKVAIGSNLDEIVKVLTHHSPLTTRHSPVILATGDPNFFGVADFMIKRFGKDEIEIIPNVSAMQEAFARIKENWSDARFLSVHGRNRSQKAEGRSQRNKAMENIADEIIKYDKIGIFTDPDNTPAKIAKAMMAKAVKDYRAYVCEDLGTDNEKITEGTLSQIAKKTFSPLNVMVLIRNNPPTPPFKKGGQGGFMFGIPDSEFSHSKGMITKEEVRVISLSKLRLKNESIVWDIGAGSGSLSVEAALFASKGMVFAIEKERNRARHIEENKKKFKVINLDVICANALNAIKTLPEPDAVFIGGGGADIAQILGACSRRIKNGGRIVVNAITIETLASAAGFFKKSGWLSETISVNIAKTKDVAAMNLFNAHNPIFVISGEKP